MGKQKLQDLCVLLQDLIVEAVKNPTSENVRFVKSAVEFLLLSCDLIVNY